jgi:hypothetical protein
MTTSAAPIASQLNVKLSVLATDALIGNTDKHIAATSNKANNLFGFFVLFNKNKGAASANAPVLRVRVAGAPSPSFQIFKIEALRVRSHFLGF